ncbi:hypothetical protein E2562_009714 [Oryza meyeriana var. granulata]|uniref:Uncharacterized protein n=1 Tax=Oryza meyeriana var. granulata TaxID=110450 RepID=A0A6G1D3P0_9ORYZ|nr:hypothetical protein E2562_009714 [Oryza meyeriana var. granulata]
MAINILVASRAKTRLSAAVRRFVVAGSVSVKIEDKNGSATAAHGDSDSACEQDVHAFEQDVPDENSAATILSPCGRRKTLQVEACAPDPVMRDHVIIGSSDPLAQLLAS